MRTLRNRITKLEHRRNPVDLTPRVTLSETGNHCGIHYTIDIQDPIKARIVNGIGLSTKTLLESRQTFSTTDDARQSVHHYIERNRESLQAAMA